jgi:hypothetical protein
MQPHRAEAAPGSTQVGCTLSAVRDESSAHALRVIAFVLLRDPHASTSHDRKMMSYSTGTSSLHVSSQMKLTSWNTGMDSRFAQTEKVGSVVCIRCQIATGGPMGEVQDLGLSRHAFR